ncbi:hypothetical protein [Sporosarcina luteola]|uniref:hypothetical protein n=1 Tax=Sporosarcina luteola TaxID=582850 RepID=UPI00203D7EBF|nr:hypothetical protein [Sporosarcina luteola]MCM3712362.1 hypothetical protein [Sporosarcina luteola]
MKKGISISVIAAGFVFAAFSNAFASENRLSYTDSSTTPVSELIYQSGDVISVTDTLYKNGKVVLFPDHSEDNPNNKNRTVVVYYQEFEKIKETKEKYDYEEDIEGEPYIGSLKLLQAEAMASGNGWTAIFSGKISKSVK